MTIQDRVSSDPHSESFSNEERRQLRRLLAREKIRECAYRYCRGVDRHDRELILSAYHPDAVHVRAEFSGGPGAFADWVMNRHDGRSARHLHYAMNQLIEFQSDDVAHVETYYMAVSPRNTSNMVTLNGGRYIDRFERRSQDWRITVRVVIREWDCEVSGTDGVISADELESSRWDRSDLSYLRPLSPRYA